MQIEHHLKLEFVQYFCKSDSNRSTLFPFYGVEPKKCSLLEFFIVCFVDIDGKQSSYFFVGRHKQNMF